MSFGKRAVPLLAALALAVPLAACGSDTAQAPAPGGEVEQTIVLYSGRSEDLINPLIPQLEEAVGATIDVRYSGTAELAAQLLEEGPNSPADVFLSQDAGALGALDQSVMLAPLGEDVTGLVAAEYRADDGTWVATSARARVIIYNKDTVTEADVPSTIDGVLDPKWRGKVAIAPTNASFQSFVTALRVARGEDGARRWLEGLVANQPVKLSNNNDILTAVNEGQVALGLANHYYWYNMAKEQGAENLAARVKYLAPGDVGALVNVAGVGVLASTDQPELAEALAAAFLSADVQRYFLEQTSEYPVIEGLPVTEEGRPQLADLQGPDIDLSDLASLDLTQEMLREVGLI